MYSYLLYLSSMLLCTCLLLCTSWSLCHVQWQYLLNFLVYDMQWIHMSVCILFPEYNLHSYGAQYLVYANWEYNFRLAFLIYSLCSPAGTWLMRLLHFCFTLYCKEMLTFWRMSWCELICIHWYVTQLITAIGIERLVISGLAAVY